MNISGGPELRWWQAKSEIKAKQKGAVRADFVYHGCYVTHGRTLGREK